MAERARQPAARTIKSDRPAVFGSPGVPMWAKGTIRSFGADGLQRGEPPVMTIQEKKCRLRRTIRELEGQLSPRYLEKSSQAIAARLLAMPEYWTAGAVFCFVGREREVDTRPILQDALDSGKILCVPLCSAPGRMELRRITALTQLLPGAYGIPEPPADSISIRPDKVDFAVVPCVTCSRTGRRLGHGGGYYDRFLAHYRSGSVLLCREQLIWDEIPVEPHDCPIPWVLTERGLYEDGVPARLG